MTTCMGKRCSFGLLCYAYVFFCEHLTTCVCGSFPFDFEGGMWDMIVIAPDQ